MTPHSPPPVEANDPNADYFLAGQDSALRTNAAQAAIAQGLDLIYRKFLLLQNGFREQRIVQYQGEITQCTKDVNQILVEFERQKEMKELKVNQKNVVQHELVQIQSGIKDIQGKNSVEVAIGTLLLIMLTLYLYTYYLTVANSIFVKGVRWPALPNFAKLQSADIAVVTLFPIFIISIGYLIHIFEKNRRLVAVILTLTLIVDIVFAYQITKREHEYDLSHGITNTLWDPSLAYGENTFYIIVLAGFGGYVVWGLLLNYVFKGWREMQPDALKKSEEARITQEIINLTEEIASLQGQLAIAESRIEQLNTTKADLQKKISKLQGGGTVVDKAGLSNMVGQFMGGWNSYINFKWALWPDSIEKRITNAKLAAETWQMNIENSLDQL